MCCVPQILQKKTLHSRTNRVRHSVQIAFRARGAILSDVYRGRTRSQTTGRGLGEQGEHGGARGNSSKTTRS